MSDFTPKTQNQSFDVDQNRFINFDLSSMLILFVVFSKNIALNFL